MNITPGIVAISLTQGFSSFIDEADLPRVSAYSWRVLRLREKNGERLYAHTSVRESLGQRGLYLHRFIISAPPGILVDHRNGDGLDNRRSNVRLASHSQNGQNSRRSHRGFRGVYWSARKSRFICGIQVERKKHYLGSFIEAADAALAYDAAAIRYHGEFAVLNFPAGCAA